VITDQLPPPSMEIQITITRKGRVAFEGVTHLKQIKRKFTDLVSWLFRDLSFPQGAYLMTGTGLVPPSDFTLVRADKITIASRNIGELVNVVG
jgi:2-dehydro-3-deoxy-D-arabinonate dehydratase